MQQKQMELARYPIVLEGEEIVIERRQSSLGELRLDPKNQRIQYALRHAGVRNATEQEIEQVLWQQDGNYLNALLNSVKQNRGLLQPLAIMSDGLVLEGNCRLVVLRKLAVDNPEEDWPTKVPCEVFPDTLTEEQRLLLLGEWHIAGKHEWRPYEQAEYLYKAARVFNKTLDYLAYHLRMGRTTILRNILAYELTSEFLARYPSPANLEKFSYFLEFQKKKVLRDRGEKDLDFKEKFFRWVAEGKLTRGEQVRGLAKHIVGNADLEKVLDEEGFEAAYACVRKMDPSLESDLYRSIDRTIIKMRNAAAPEIQDLRAGNESKIKKLRELYKVLKGIADLASVRLDVEN